VTAPQIQASISKCHTKAAMIDIINKSPEAMHERLEIHAKTILYMRRDK